MDTRGLVRKSEANTPEIASATTAIASNSARSSWFIQNLGTNTLYVRRGADASTAVFHHALKAGSVNDDGTGGSVGDTTGVIFTGEISIAGVSPRYVITETN